MHLDATQSATSTVLLAEDNNAVRGLLCSQLETFGYRVVEARDGMQALQRFDDLSSDIDVAVLDFRMPRTDGFEVFKELRSRNPDLPVIFMTGDAGELPHVVLSRYTDIVVVSKPFSGIALHEEIQILCNA